MIDGVGIRGFQFTAFIVTIAVSMRYVLCYPCAMLSLHVLPEHACRALSQAGSCVVDEAKGSAIQRVSPFRVWTISRTVDGAVCCGSVALLECGESSMRRVRRLLLHGEDADYCSIAARVVWEGHGGCV